MGELSADNKCQCELCAKWSPLFDRIRAKLSGEDLRLFEEFLMKEANECENLAVAEAKLAGDWTRWEWMKEAVKQHSS